ncbi:MAG: YaiI/YqxD family protein [Deltaproteobacteria bacterium]|nr:MAG: YaiI/YqxD family protein [Deltaproteobacteria bacterium]
MKVWVDADGCPKMVKEIVFRAVERLKLTTVVVANHEMYIPRSTVISKVLVQKGFDVADHHIIENVEPFDLVITADIPLAAEIVTKDAFALSPRGELYTEENIRERLSIRNFMQDIRDHGGSTGGPRPLRERDRREFASSLDRTLTLLRRGESPL